MMRHSNGYRPKAANPWASVLLVLLFLSVSRAQEVAKLNLKVQEEITVAEESGGVFFDPIRCDIKGNIYLRHYEPKNVFAAPIVRISSKGERSAIFSVESVPTLKRSEVYDFATGPGREVYTLIGTPRGQKVEVAVAIFRDDGTFQSATELKGDFSAAQLAVFPTGEFLVSGWRPIQTQDPKAVQELPKDKPAELPPVQPFTAIFDRNGNVVIEVSLSVEANAAHPDDYAKLSSISGSAISLGATVTGEDGNVYLMLAGDKPMLFAISAAGTVVSTRSLMPPSEKMGVLQMRAASGNRLVFEFAEKRPGGRYLTQSSVFSVTDAASGERLIDYQSSPEAGGAFACYASEGFTFLTTTKEGRLAIRRAVTR